MNGTLLIYGYEDDTRRQALDEMARHFSFQLRFVTDDEAGQQVGYLLAIPGYTHQATPATLPLPAIDFVLLHQVPDTLHADLFTYMRDHDIATGNKAVVTPTNQEWTLEHLLRENDAEHRIVTLWQHLRQAVTYAEAWEEKYGDDPALHQALVTAKPYEVLTETLSVPAMTQAYRNLIDEVMRVDALKPLHPSEE